MSSSITYPLCHRFGLTYSSFEDRLIISADLQDSPVRVLLTRNMVIRIVKTLLAHLPSFSKLDKTPRAFWQEALNISHQQAMKLQADLNTAATQPVEKPVTFNVQQPSSNASVSTKLFLATELNSEQKDEKLLLGLTGLAVPQAMTIPSPHEPILALTLETQHLHQLLQLFINKASEAQWNIPFDLPWMQDKPVEQRLTSH